MEEKKKERRSPMVLPLNKRLALITVLILVPMTLLVGYLLYLVYFNNREFEKMANSVTYANVYATEFRDRMDYSMYQSIIRGESVGEIDEGKVNVNGVKIVNPYNYIDEIENAFDYMAEIATVSSNKNLIRRMKNTLRSLEKKVEEIEKNQEEPISYDKNMGILKGDIYSLTEIIEDGILEYIYVENDHFGAVNIQMMAKTQRTTQLSMFLVIIVFFLAVVLSLMASRSVTRPIQNLCEMTRKLGRGDFSARTDVVEAQDEIAVLTSSFNDMAREISDLVEGIKKEQNNLRFTESKLLQAQINPHFLYNTLDTIVWLAEEGQNEDVVSMVTWLSDFFRTTLSKGKDYITVDQEKTHISSYLKIQQFRYQDIMDYEIDIDEEMGEYLIPKLTLQPLVENALYHGIKLKRGKGKIIIRGFQKENRLYFKVIDNGKGMTRECLTNLRHRIAGVDPLAEGGFGLANVNQRIKYYYGDEYGVFFESEENVGTEATVIIQAKKIITLS